MTDHASGSREDRPGLTRLLDELRQGDVLTVWKLDRLGRSLSHLVAVVDDLGRRSVEFRSLTESLDTTTPAGRLLFHVVAAVAQFEREMTVERTRAALALAKRNRRTLGRPSRVNERQFRLIHQMYKAGGTQGVIASTTGLTRAVVGCVIRGEIASLDRARGVLPVRSLISAQRRSALSTVRTSRATTRPRRPHAGHRTHQASSAMAWWHLGCINALSKSADTRKVDE